MTREEQEALRAHQCLRKRAFTHAQADDFVKSSHRDGRGGKVKGKERKYELTLSSFRCCWDLPGWDEHWHVGHTPKNSYRYRNQNG